jgi:hypothetical protein
VICVDERVVRRRGNYPRIAAVVARCDPDDLAYRR